MLSVFLTIILALLISFLVTMDSSSSTLYWGTTTLSGIPLFYIVFASIVIGALLSSVTTIKNVIESKLTVFGKNRDLNKSFKTVEQQQAQIDKLEEEKSALGEQLKELTSNRKSSTSSKEVQKDPK